MRTVKDTIGGKTKRGRWLTRGCLSLFIILNLGSVVFMNRPCVPDDLERCLEERVLSVMTPGAHLFLGQPVIDGPAVRRI